ncbi:MAG: hypothetical protein J7L34_05165 [Thermotogaceae bacterium]|nr:hypothetical protein [Thermotogaceae bacterium]
MWNSNERKQFGQLMVLLAENYNREYSQALQKAWEYKLRQYPYKQVEKAILEYIATKKFPPKLADIVELLEKPCAINKETAEALAEQAWAEVLSYMATVGAYESVKFRDPIVNAVIKQLGGWITLCQKTYSELETNTKWDFKKLYIAYAISGSCPEVNYLPGINELTNEQVGFCEAIKLPLLIGQERIKVQLVYLEEETQRLALEDKSNDKDPEPIKNLLKMEKLTVKQ